MNKSSAFENFPDILVPIGTVAKMFNVCARTIRIYEEEGLLPVKRTDKNRRQYGKKEILIIQTIIFLTQKLNVNLAGIKIIFALFKIFKVEFEEQIIILKSIKNRTTTSLKN